MEIFFSHFSSLLEQCLLSYVGSDTHTVNMLVLAGRQPVITERSMSELVVGVSSRQQCCKIDLGSSIKTCREFPGLFSIFLLCSCILSEFFHGGLVMNCATVTLNCEKPIWTSPYGLRCTFNFDLACVEDYLTWKYEIQNLEG